MAIALKDLKRELMVGLYPGWKVTQDFTTDTVLIEGPDGYVSRVARFALDNCGLDGVMEFILQKDQRMKREAALQVPLYEQVRKQIEAEEYAAMCAKGSPGAAKTATEIKAQVEYESYMRRAQQAFIGSGGGSGGGTDTRMLIMKAGEVAGIPAEEMEKYLEPMLVTVETTGGGGGGGGMMDGRELADYQPSVRATPADYNPLPVGTRPKPKKKDPIHKPWTGVREVDLD